MSRKGNVIKLSKIYATLNRLLHTSFLSDEKSGKTVVAMMEGYFEL
ncbi:MAG: hypothetical protein NTZ69_18075 [Bacteroidia bacterium]|nr:hypothetical protein [Bacteroidia bacterium]